MTTADLLAQDCPGIVELVVDGGTTDGTVDIARGSGCLVTLVPNPAVTAAAAMNRRRSASRPAPVGSGPRALPVVSIEGGCP